MSSPMSSTLVPSQNYSHHHGTYLDQLGFGEKHSEGFTEHLYMNPSYSMQKIFVHENHAVRQIHGSAARKSLKTEDLPFYHQAPPAQYTQHLNQGVEDPVIWLQPEQQLPAAQPQQIGQQTVGEEVLAVQLERPLFGMGKPRLRWTPELHERFVCAVVELGGLFCARPKAILSKMNVKGLTADQIKSHLQKVRTRDAKDLLHRSIQNRMSGYSPQLSGQGSLTSRSTAPVNGKGLESSQADIGEYEKFLQSSETPNYYQNLRFAPWGDHRGNTNGSNFGL